MSISVPSSSSKGRGDEVRRRDSENNSSNYAWDWNNNDAYLSDKDSDSEAASGPKYSKAKLASAERHATPHGVNHRHPHHEVTDDLPRLKTKDDRIQRDISSTSMASFTVAMDGTYSHPSHKIASQAQVADKVPTHHHHPSHSHSSTNAILGLWMLLDGIGLAIITTATILEGYELWTDFFNKYWDYNTGSLSLWFTGRTFQIIGLLFLIGHASCFQIFPDVERFGMFMLTLGPIINLSSCFAFHMNNNESLMLFKQQWASTEVVEIIGISILDISLIDMEEHFVLAAEIIGFMILCCAAALQFNYSADFTWPLVTCRLDVVHSSECCGLLMLTVVAYGQYRIKLYKHELEEAKHNASTGSTSAMISTV